MNLSELQAFLEESNWDDDPLPAHPSDAKSRNELLGRGDRKDTSLLESFDEESFDDTIPTLIPDAELNKIQRVAPVKLVPRVKEEALHQDNEDNHANSMKDRLAEVEMAQKMGYLLCKCTWPPQIMVLTGTDHVYRCRRCSRVREI